MLIFAIHNVIRFTRDIKILGNKVLVRSFYFCTITEALLSISHGVFFEFRPGELIYDLCRSQENDIADRLMLSV